MIIRDVVYFDGKGEIIIVKEDLGFVDNIDLSDRIVYKSEDDRLLNDMKCMIYSFLLNKTYVFEERSISKAKLSFNILMIYRELLNKREQREFDENAHNLFFQMINEDIDKEDILLKEMFSVRVRKKLKKVNLKEYCLFYMHNHTLLDYKGGDLKKGKMIELLEGLLYKEELEDQKIESVL